MSRVVLARVEAELVLNQTFQCLRIQIPVAVMPILVVDWVEWEAVEVSSSYQQSIKTRHLVQ